MPQAHSSRLFIFLSLSLLTFTIGINHKQFPNTDCTGEEYTETIIASNDCSIPRGINDMSTSYNCLISNASELVMSASTYYGVSDCASTVAPVVTTIEAEKCVVVGVRMSTFIDCSDGISMNHVLRLCSVMMTTIIACSLFLLVL